MTEDQKRKQRERELIRKLDPEAAAFHEKELIRTLDPEAHAFHEVHNAVPTPTPDGHQTPAQRGVSDYDPNVSINSLGLVPPTTPTSHMAGAAIPGANLINYTNLQAPPPALPSRERPSMGEFAHNVRTNFAESLKKFGNSAWESVTHPRDTYDAVTNGLPSIDKIESAVSAAPATFNGMVLNQLSPEVRAIIEKNHPELKAPIEQGKSFSEEIHNVGQAVVDYGKDMYMSRPGEGPGTALTYSAMNHPWQVAADLSWPASLGVSGGGSLAARALSLAKPLGQTVEEALIAKGMGAGIAKAVRHAPMAAALTMNPLNALIPAGMLASGATRKVLNALTPERRAMLEMANGKGKEISLKLQDAIDHPIISEPTAAQAIEPNPHRPPVTTAGMTPISSGTAIGPAPMNARLGAGPTNQLPSTPQVNLLPPGAAAKTPLGLLGDNVEQHYPNGPTGPILVTRDGRHVLPPGAGDTLQLNEGQRLLNAGDTLQLNEGQRLLNAGDEAPSYDSRLLDGETHEMINGPVDSTESMVPYEGTPRAPEPQPAAPVQQNEMNPNRRQAPPEPQPELQQAPPEPQQAPPELQPEPQPQQAPPEPEQAPPEPEQAPPESSFDFMGHIHQVEKLIDQQPHLEAGLQKAVTRAEAAIAKAEAGLLTSSDYGKKFSEIARMPKLAQQEAEFQSWLADEPNAEEVARHYSTLKKSLLMADAAKRRIAEMPQEMDGWRSTLDKLRRGEEGSSTVEGAVGGHALEFTAQQMHQMYTNYHAGNEMAGVVTLRAHSGVGPRGVHRTGTPGVLATKFSAAGAQARLNDPDAFALIDEKNNAARIRVVNGAGKTGPAGSVDRTTAEAAHDALAKHEYGIAGRIISNGDATLHNITTRDLSSSVMERARKNMGEGGEAFQTGSYVPAHVDATGKAVPAVYPKYSGKALQAIKQAFDDLSFDHNVITKGGASASDVRKIQATRAEFLRWVGLRSKNPQLITAMKNYSARENQIARMKMAEHFESILQKPATDEYTIQQRADAFANAAHPKNQAQTILDATGRRMHTTFDSLLTPNEASNIQSIKDDIMREKLAEGHAYLGRQHTSATNTAASDGIGVTHVPGKGGMINHIKEMITGGADDRVSKSITKGMETAPGALRLMQNALRQQGLLDVNGEAIRKTAMLYHNSLNRVFPTHYNVEQQQRDRKKLKEELR